MKLGLNAVPKGWGMWSALVFGITLAMLLVMVDEPSQRARSSARMSDEFVNSIGVNTHFRFLDTVYNSKYRLIKGKLAALGVRHVRDAAFIYPRSKSDDLVYGRYRELAELGVHFNLGVSPRLVPTVDAAKIAQIAEMAGPSLESFEGPNEYNLRSSNPNWAKELTDYQKDLYTAVKSNPSTSSVPVIGPALGRPYPPEKPDLSAYVDYANMHSYPGGNNPVDWHLDNHIIPAARAVGGTKPLIATETGYHTAANWDGPHNGVSETAMGKYMPRLLFEYFNRRIHRTYIYEFIDDMPDPKSLDRGAHFGLLRNDGTEKPAYKALKNLIFLLEDPGPNFKTESLNYALRGDLQEVHRTLLQKRNGMFYLVLWQEVPSYNINTKQDISVPTKKVTLTLKQPIGEAITYLPNRSVAPVKQYATPKRLTLNVPDEVLVVKLTPSK